MGEVKDKVKGDGLKKKLLRKKKIVEGRNLIEYFEALEEEVSECIEIKDDDALSEGDDAKANNVRKAGLLRCVHSLLVSGRTLLEDY